MFIFYERRLASEVSQVASRRFYCRLVATLGFLLPAFSAFAVVPSQLQGKSIVVRWSSDQIQTFEGETQSVHRNTNHELAVYISKMGRAFTKLYNSTPGRGSAESLQGPSDRQASRGDSRVVHFEASTLLVDSKKESAARRITVSFDGAYANCTARVQIGKEVGARRIYQTGMISGRRMEVHSIKVSAVTCAIRNGNVFE